MKTTYDKISEVLIKARKAKGYSRERMAKAMNVSPDTIKHYENGVTKISPDTFAKWFQITKQDIYPALIYIFDIELDQDQHLYNLIQNMETKKKELLIKFLEE